MAQRPQGCTCVSVVALLLSCSVAVWAMYLHIVHHAQLDAVHASLRGMRSDLASTNSQLKLALSEIEALKSDRGSGTLRALSKNPSADAYANVDMRPNSTYISASMRVHALRHAHPNPRPLPPTAVVDSEVGRQVEERRKRAGYGGDSTDGEHIGGWKRNDTNGWEPRLWDWLIDVQKVESFIDVGCGAGVVTKYFLDKGVDARCVEASNEAINQSFVPIDRIVQHDFTLGPWFPEGVVDVAYTVEFLEHVDIKYLDNVMALLKSARYVIMAASKQGGWSHVNVHFKWWWIEKMEAYGFKYSPRMTEVLLANLVLKTTGPDAFVRGYSYMDFTGLIFRNPEVDFDNMLKEPGDMPSRKQLWAKHQRFLRGCSCF
mmetsp:Transcript_27456/g.52286  ORF Transcript_27456/g.52286 Transcript_27456/m.52286 type:complete len:374 (+) Transcript_27456:681-1802(+)